MLGGGSMNVNALAKVATKAGMILLESGAETFRVEDTMRRIVLAYGASVVDSYATPTLIIISFTLDDELCHNVKRTQIKSVDLTKIDKVNELSRQIQVLNIPLDEFNKALDEINRSEHYPKWIQMLGAAICTFGFTFFFFGGLKDAIWAFVLGWVLKFMLLKLDEIEFSSFFKNIVGGAFVTFVALVLAKLKLCNNLDTLIISVYMLLVPGLAITNAIRDTVSGDTVSGMARAMEAVLTAVAIAFGSGLIFMIMGGY